MNRFQIDTLVCGLTVLAASISFSVGDCAAAADFYVSQNGSGTTNSLAWLNNSANWGVGANKIAPGNTVHLVGTFTNTLTIRGGGTAGNPVTIHFESGANFTSGCWPITGAIALNGQSYITIDGGANGLIQNTSNGTGLATSVASSGIAGTINFGVIQNLTITNIYNRVAGSSDPYNYGNCITVGGGSITISNCSVSDADGVISYSGPAPGNTLTESNIFILNNRILNWDHGITIGMGNSDVGPQHCFLTNVVISGNFLDHADKWDGYPTLFHMDGIIIENNTFDPTVVINGIRIYQNLWGPNFVSNATTNHGATAAIAQYLDGEAVQMQNCFIYNNVFQTYDTNGWANGFGGVNGSNVWIVNNTCESIGTHAIQRGTLLAASGTNAYCYNNILCPGGGISLRALYGSITTNTYTNSALNNLYVLTTYFGGVWSDYNVFQPVGGANEFSLMLTEDMAGGTVWNSGIFGTLQKWQTYINNRFGWPTPIFNTLHCDPHSTTNTPLYIPGTFVPAANDVVVHNAGTNLTCLGITNDFNGNPRPATGPWDIGAYEYVGLPVFQAAQQTGGNIAFTWSAIVSTNYQFQTATNLNGGNWQNYGPLITATNSIMSFSNVMSPGPQRFYRLLVE